MSTQNFDGQRSRSSNSNYTDYGSGFLYYLNNNSQNNIPINTNSNINDTNSMNPVIYGDSMNQISKFDSYSDVYNRVVSDPSNNINNSTAAMTNQNGDLNYNMNMEQLQYLDSINNNNNNNNSINLQNMSSAAAPIITYTPSNNNIPINSTMSLQQPTPSNINDIQSNNTNIHNNLSSRNYIAVNDFNNNSNNNSILPFTSHNNNYSIPKSSNDNNNNFAKTQQNSYTPLLPMSPSSISSTSTKNKDKSSIKRINLADIKDIDSLTNYDDTQRFKYGCSICQKRFKRPSSLKTHINIHTGFKPFNCPYMKCNKSFNAKSNMLRHYKLHFKLRSGAYILPDGHISMDKPTSKQLFNSDNNDSLTHFNNKKSKISKKTIVEHHQ